MVFVANFVVVVIIENILKNIRWYFLSSYKITYNLFVYKSYDLFVCLSVVCMEKWRSVCSVRLGLVKQFSKFTPSICETNKVSWIPFKTKVQKNLTAICALS